MSEVDAARRSKRREREHASARAAILDAARRLATRDGARGLTLRGVATEAGYAPAALYGYFKNRGELVLALAADELAALSKSMRNAGSDAAGPNKLADATRAALSYLADAEAIAAALAELPSNGEPSSARHFNGRLIAAMIAFADAAGLPSASRENQCDVALLSAMIAGLALLARAGRLEALGFEKQELIDRLASRFAVV
jgi:AcrR family transcriptional regulator